MYQNEIILCSIESGTLLKSAGILGKRKVVVEYVQLQLSRLNKIIMCSIQGTPSASIKRNISFDFLGFFHLSNEFREFLVGQRPREKKERNHQIRVVQRSFTPSSFDP